MQKLRSQYAKPFTALWVLAAVTLLAPSAHAKPLTAKEVAAVVAGLTDHFSPGDPTSSCRKRVPMMAKVVLPNLDLAIKQSGKEFTKAMKGLVWQGHNKVPAWGALQKRFQQELEAELKMACRSRTLADAFKLLTELTTQNYADALLAKWMEHAVPKHAASKTWSKLDLLPHAQSSIARVKRTSGALSLGTVTTRSDSGGPGTDNGVVDAGEWAYIDVEIVNKSNAPHFSSSALVVASGCAFVPEAGMEIRLAEMPVDGKATLSFWMYQGPCASRAAPSVSINILDTHQSKSTFELNFELGNAVTTPKLHSQKLDQDMPGFSHTQTELHYVKPKSSFELTHELTVTGSPRLVDLGYAEPSDAGGLLKAGAHIHRSTEMRHVGNGRYKPNDDWDRTVEASSARYLTVLQNLKGSRRWLDAGTPSPLWLAVNVEVRRGTSAKGATAGADTQTATRAAPSAKVVSRLLRDHITFRSRPVTPSADAAAAVAGHDVLLDFESFKGAYNALTGRSKAGGGWLEDKWSAMADDGRRYTYRYYVPLLIDVPAAKPKPKPRPRPRPRLRPSAPVVVVAPEAPAPWVRFDTGAAFSALFISDDFPTNEYLWYDTDLATATTLFIPEGYVRLTLGNTWAGVFELRGGQSHVDVVTNTRWDLGAGLAYVASWGAFELQPRLGLSMQGREVERGLNNSDDLIATGSIGLTLRYFFSDEFGLHADLSGLFGASGPGTPSRFTGVGLHFGSGISLRF
jgi:hypothetical protein